MSVHSSYKFQSPPLVGFARPRALRFDTWPAAIAMCCAIVTADQIVMTGWNALLAQNGARPDLRIGVANASSALSEALLPAAAVAADADVPRKLHVAAIDTEPQGTGVADTPVTSNIRPLTIAIGDQLKVAVYERLEAEEDKWIEKPARIKPPTISLQLRPEFTGDYSVQENGAVALPLLGTFAVAGQSLEDLQGNIATAYARLLGRQGIVNVRLAERLPVYILGPVKNSGTYKFSAGMTAWHAVALAGGFERLATAGDRLGSRLEATREFGSLGRNGERAASLMARKAVLTAEREQRPVSVPSDLLEIAGRSTADALLAGEVAARALVTAARDFAIGWRS